MIKNIRLFTFLFVASLFVSCSSNDNETEKNNESLIKKITIDITYPSYFTFNPQEINFVFEYDKKGRLVKRIGGYLPYANSSGLLGTYFTDQTYTSLNYNNSKVTVESFSSSENFTVPKGTIIYTLNSSNQIQEKEIPNETNNVHSKKQLFKYEAGKLIEIVTSFPNMPYDANDENDYILTYSEKFYYDANSNLIRTEYFEQHNGQKTDNKTVRTFEDYDNAVNPIKNLQLLEGYFYRSLSKNNFRKYTETAYYKEGSVLKDSYTWVFLYDSNGNIIL